MKDVKPTSLLKDRVREIEGNPDFSNKDISASQTQSQMVAEANSGMLSTLNQVELQSELANPSLPSGHSNVSTQTCVHLFSPSVVQVGYLFLIYLTSLCLMASVCCPSSSCYKSVGGGWQDGNLEFIRTSPSRTRTVSIYSIPVTIFC